MSKISESRETENRGVIARGCEEGWVGWGVTGHGYGVSFSGDEVAFGP